MAGFFFTYSASVVLALDKLSASVYTTMMQEINETVLNVVFGIVFFGAIVVPTVSAAVVLLQETGRRSPASCFSLVLLSTSSVPLP
ncbi:hypothetical protein ACFFQF_17445 [Haladaptatus pallidirubidus]|uniref:hypothetical protein n=1 Tax=Haladaptatus pallidirubidus TaxID=1008152 RepID=UPI0035E99F75